MNINSTTSAIQSALRGYQSAEEGVAESALEISRLNLGPGQSLSGEEAVVENTLQQKPQPSLEAEAVNLIVNERLAQANVNVIRTADEMIGTLIDTKV